MKPAENSQKQSDFPCTELGACATIPAMETRENPPETDVWPHCVDTSAHSLLPAINWNAACARLRARQARDVVVRASRICAECGSGRSTVDGGVETSCANGDASPSAFDNCGTINTESDLGMSGE